MGRAVGNRTAGEGGNAIPVAGTVFGAAGAGRALGASAEGSAGAMPGAAIAPDRAEVSRVVEGGATAVGGTARCGA
jgi:hypothetical protein